MAKDAKGHGSEARSVRAGSYDGKPVFHGVNSGGKVTNRFGNPIAYASPEAAVAGAAGAAKPILSVAQSAAHAGFVDRAAATALANDHPKSAAVPIHGGASGRSDKVAGVKYRGPTGSSNTKGPRDPSLIRGLTRKV